MDLNIPRSEFIQFGPGCQLAREFIRANANLALRYAKVNTPGSGYFYLSFPDMVEGVPTSLCNLAMKIFCKNISSATISMMVTSIETAKLAELLEEDAASYSEKDSVTMFNLTQVLAGSFGSLIALLQRQSLSRKSVSIFVRSWPTILRCMKFMLTGSVLADFLSKHFLKMVIPLHPHLFTGIGSKNVPKVRDLLSNNDFSEVMAHLWLVDHKASLSGRPLTVEPWATNTLACCLGVIEQNSTFLEEVLEHAGLDWDAFTSHLHCLLQRFWDGDNGEQRNYQNVAIAARALFRVTPLKEFWTSNMKKKFLPLMMQVFTGTSKAIDRARAGTDLDAHFQVMEQCLMIFIHTIVFAPGLTRSIQLFHRGLLRALFNCIPAVANSPSAVRAALGHLVLHVLPSELIYGPVIDAASEAWLKTIMNRGAPKFENDFFRKEWKFLQTLIMERAIQKKVFISKTGGQFSATCNRPGCTKREHEVRFVRCAGCRLAVYCSKECQTISWQKFLHRKICEISYIPEDEHVQQRDLHCALSILSRETFRHRRGLKALARRKFPGTPLSELIVCIDYTQRKLIFDVRPPARSDEEIDKSQKPEASENLTKVNADATTTNFHRPDNAFLLLRVSMKQGGLWLEMVHNSVRELQVPDDDDLRPVMKIEGLRLQGEDMEGNLLETTWDEIDETLYTMDTFRDGDPTTGIPMCSLDHLVTNYASWLKADEC